MFLNQDRLDSLSAVILYALLQSHLSGLVYSTAANSQSSKLTLKFEQKTGNDILLNQPLQVSWPSNHN